MSLSDEILGDLKKKKAPAVAKGAEGAPDDEGAEREYEGDEQAIAGDIADAVKSGDSAALAEGLRSFIEACYPQLAK